jgi:hypothetical protein
MNLTNNFLISHRQLKEEKIPPKIPIGPFRRSKVPVEEETWHQCLASVHGRKNQYSDTQPPQIYIKRAPLVQFFGCEMALLLPADRGVGGAIHPSDLSPTEK